MLAGGGERSEESKDEANRSLLSGNNRRASVQLSEDEVARRKVLHAAVLENDIARAKKALETLPADADQATITPLMRASALGLGRMVKLLLQSGADVHKVDINCRTALHYACTEYTSQLTKEREDMLAGRKTVVKLLMRAGAVPNIPDRFGKTPKDLAQFPPESTPYLKYFDSKQLVGLLETGADAHDDDLGEDDDDDGSSKKCLCCTLL